MEILEFQIFKAEMSHSVHEQDREFYRETAKKSEDEIKLICDEIEKAKHALSIEQEKKRNRTEYNLLSENIIQYEEQEIMNQKISKIKEEIEILQKEYENNMNKIEQKEKELHLLVFYFIFSLFYLFAPIFIPLK